MDTFLFYFYTILFSLIILCLITFLILEIQKSRFLDLEITRLRKKIYQEKGTEKDYYNLANIYIKKKLYSQAQQEFFKILKNKNLDKVQFALIYNSLGYIYSEQEQYEPAIEYYKKALSYIPDFISARINLAHIFELQNLKVEAINLYEEVLTFDPNNKVARRKLQLLKI
uniref:Uncharacterized protein n=1 Tax=Cyanophora paradoxa TaxID=2762 RepID=A0A097PBL5_CYAPA|nr:hypothetical protein [Cyanophora paradoxa]